MIALLVLELLKFASLSVSGMLIEFMAGKAACMEGRCYDATPFTYTEQDDPITFFGERLKAGLFHFLYSWKMFFFC